MSIVLSDSAEIRCEGPAKLAVGAAAAARRTSSVLDRLMPPSYIRSILFFECRDLPERLESCVKEAFLKCFSCKSLSDIQLDNLEDGPTNSLAAVLIGRASSDNASVDRFCWRGEFSARGDPIYIGQLTILDDGFAIGLATHHWAVDGLGHTKLLHAWAAAMHGALPTLSTDRSWCSDAVLTAVDPAVADHVLAESSLAAIALRQVNLSGGRLASGIASVAVQTSAGGALPSEATCPLPATAACSSLRPSHAHVRASRVETCRAFVSAERLEALRTALSLLARRRSRIKSASDTLCPACGSNLARELPRHCSPCVACNLHFSRNDVLTAAVWQAITAARLNAGLLAPDASTSVGFAVDVRRRCAPLVHPPDNYIGNAVVVARTASISAGDLLSTAAMTQVPWGSRGGASSLDCRLESSSGGSAPSTDASDSNPSAAVCEEGAAAPVRPFDGGISMTDASSTAEESSLRMVDQLAAGLLDAVLAVKAAHAAIDAAHVIGVAQHALAAERAGATVQLDFTSGAGRLSTAPVHHHTTRSSATTGKSESASTAADGSMAASAADCPAAPAIARVASEPPSQMGTSSQRGDVAVTNWSKLGLQDVDFGCGPPCDILAPPGRSDGVVIILPVPLPAADPRRSPHCLSVPGYSRAAAAAAGGAGFCEPPLESIAAAHSSSCVPAVTGPVAHVSSATHVRATGSGSRMDPQAGTCGAEEAAVRLHVQLREGACVKLQEESLWRYLTMT